MFEIFEDEITTFEPPKKVWLARIQKKKGELRKLKIHNFEEIGAAWASHASELREVGITSLELNPFKNFSAVYWLDQFPFLEELSLRTDNLPEESCALT